MRNVYTKLLLLFAGATQKELARQLSYLKIENRILRSKLPVRVPATTKERNRLVRFGTRLGKALNELVSIVHPDTLRRWIRESRRLQKMKPSMVGRKPTTLSIPTVGSDVAVCQYPLIDRYQSVYSYLRNVRCRRRRSKASLLANP